MNTACGSYYQKKNIIQDCAIYYSDEKKKETNTETRIMLSRFLQFINNDIHTPSFGFKYSLNYDKIFKLFMLIFCLVLILLL